MLLYWLWLAEKSKLSARIKQTLLQRFCDPEDLYYADTQALSAVEGLSADAIEVLLDKDLTPARDILNECKQKNIRILTFADDRYPVKLRNIYDPPLVLYYTGKLPDWEEAPVIGVVGTRKATVYGVNTARRFGAQISACGAIVVSGGAAGIDTAALEGALEAGGPVVAVLGCGVDVVYPAKNRGLFERIRQNGCLISEYKPGEQALSWHFLPRNRIITGMSNGLLVVEAPEKSGALNSARHAMEQGRDVFVVPGNVDVETCAGSNALLEENAVAALSGWHVVREYAAIYPGKVQHRDPPARPEQPAVMVAQTPAVPKAEKAAKPACDKKSIDKEEKSTYSVVNNPFAALSDQERQVLAMIGPGMTTVDQVIAATDMGAPAVKAILTRLTIKGLVQSHPGGRVSVRS